MTSQTGPYNLPYIHNALRWPVKFLRYPAVQLALILLLTLAIRLLYLFYTDYAVDDAFITFRYARMLAEGQGFVFNPGERVYGTTTPLFTLLLAAWMVVTKSEPLIGARLLTISAAVGTVAFTWLAVRRLGGNTAQQAAAGLALGLSANLIPHEVNGMETGLIPCLMAASWWAFTAKRFSLAGLLCGLLLWVRVDTALWPLVLVLAAYFIEPRAALKLGFTAAVVYLPWVVFAGLYFGSPIPHTIPAKLAAYNPLETGTVYSRLVYILENLVAVPVPPLRPGLLALVAGVPLALAAYQSWTGRRSLRVFLLAFFAIIQMAYLVLTGSTFFTRYLVSLQWAVLTLAGLGFGALWARLNPSSRPGLGWLAGMVSLAFIFTYNKLTDIGPRFLVWLETRYPALIIFLLLVWLALCLAFWALKRLKRPGHWIGRPALLIALFFMAWIGVTQFIKDTGYIRTAQQIRLDGTLRGVGTWLADHTPQESVVMLEPLGYVGYYSGRIIRDEVGLVTPTVTKLKQAGNQEVITYLAELNPDYLVGHCDDLLRWQEDYPFTSRYQLAEVFNPLNFVPWEVTHADKNIQWISRDACYEIWSKK